MKAWQQFTITSCHARVVILLVDTRFAQNERCRLRQRCRPMPSRVRPMVNAGTIETGRAPSSDRSLWCAISPRDSILSRDPIQWRDSINPIVGATMCPLQLLGFYPAIRTIYFEALGVRTGEICPNHFLAEYLAKTSRRRQTMHHEWSPNLKKAKMHGRGVGFSWS